jgi:hypothetical protein
VLDQLRNKPNGADDFCQFTGGGFSGFDGFLSGAGL